MGQNYPYLPNGQTVGIPSQFPPAPYNMVGAQGAGKPAAFPQQQPPSTGIPGVDPGMMAAAQQSLAKPNAEDAFNILPGPKEMAMGAVGGMGIAYGLNLLMQDQSTMANKVGPIAKFAKSLDNTRVAQWLNKRLNQGILDKTATSQEKGWLKEMLLTHATHGDGPVKAMQEMEHRQLGFAMRNFQKHFAKRPEVKAAYDQLMKEQALRTSLQQAGVHPALNFLEASKIPDIQKAGFEQVIQGAETKIAHLKQLPQKTKAQKQLLRSLENLYERVHGIQGHYGTMYRSQAELARQLTQKDIGPVGRMFASSFHYLQRIFNGETMKMGASAAENGAKQGLFSKAGKLVFPGLAGAMIIGQSFDKAKKAQDGEHVKTFAHDFLGNGLFNFIGWEVGRKILNSINFADRLLGKRVSNRLPGFLAKIPVIGGITLGGFVTEMVALFAVGWAFQKVGEKIAHMIFGTPSEASLEGKSKQSQNQQTNPAIPTIPGLTGGQNGMAQAGGQAGYRPQTAMSQPIQPNSFTKPQPMYPGYGQFPQQSQKQQGPMFSITPDQIRKSPVAMQAQALQNQIQGNS